MRNYRLAAFVAFMALASLLGMAAVNSLEGNAALSGKAIDLEYQGKLSDSVTGACGLFAIASFFYFSKKKREEHKALHKLHRMKEQIGE
jgi:hypothetical protein